MFCYLFVAGILCWCVQRVDRSLWVEAAYSLWGYMMCLPPDRGCFVLFFYWGGGMLGGIGGIVGVVC